MPATTETLGIPDESARETRGEVIELLTKAYWMEMEAVMSYVAASTNPDGLRAREVVEALEDDVDGELDHARKFA